MDRLFPLTADTSQKAAKAAPKADPGLREVPILKSEEERFVFGVVLEPTKELNKPDSQGDIYSAEEVRNACHAYMEKFQTIGIQHQEKAGDRVKILENFIAPCDLNIDGKIVAKGTWLLGVRVIDDGLWDKVKSGDITGFSIGGFAKRTPVRSAAGGWR